MDTLGEAAGNAEFQAMPPDFVPTPQWADLVRYFEEAGPVKPDDLEVWALRALAAGQGVLSAILYTIARDLAIDDLDSLGETVLTHACEARPGRRRARAAERN
jgi:hypothetical protein